jgi:hypothetical protein
MLAVFLVIIGTMGLALNWPTIQKGILEGLTVPWLADSVVSAVRGCSAFLRLDGKIILVLAAAILVSAFIRTTRILLNVRLMVLAVILAIISAEIFMVLIHDYPLSSYTGTLYSLIFYFMAFAASIFRFGSIKSLNSTFMGRPLSESKAFSQTFGSFLGHVSSAVKVKFTAEDNIGRGWNKGEEREFDSNEIRIGREADWANLAVGKEWTSVSNRHGVIRVIGKTLLYEPTTDYYSFSINGIPSKESKELPNQSVLSLVSGHGPSLAVNFSIASRSLFHLKTMGRVGEITSDEFKKLRFTFKIMVIMTLLALPLLWGFKGLQDRYLDDHIKQQADQKIKIEKKLKEKSEETDKLRTKQDETQARVQCLKEDVTRLKKQNLQKNRELAEKSSELEILKRPTLPGEEQKKIEQAAKIIDIRFCSQRTNVYFPFVICFEKGKTAKGTGFFAREQNGKVYLITLKNTVFDTKKGKWGHSFFFIYRDTWQQFLSCCERIKKSKQGKQKFSKDIKNFPGLYQVLYISRSGWKEKKIEIHANGFIKMEIENFPEYLFNDTPVIDGKFSASDKIAFFGCSREKKFYSAGIIRNIHGPYIYIHADTKNGFPGGPLLKVLANGKYTVIGIFQSKNKFIKF